MAHASTQIHRWSRAALLAAVAVVNGFLLVAVPNVELVTATIAVAGLLLGPGHGFLVGVVAAGVFGAANPVGSSLAVPSLWVAQMLAQGLNGLYFGLLRRPLDSLDKTMRVAVFSLLGALVTVQYQALLAVSFYLFMPPSESTLLGFLIAGIAYSAIQIGSNALVFAIVVPVAARRLRGFVGSGFFGSG